MKRHRKIKHNKKVCHIQELGYHIQGQGHNQGSEVKSCLSNYLKLAEANFGGWSGGAMVLGKLPVPGRPTIWITVGQGLIALAVGAGGGGLDIFTLIYPFSFFSLSFGDGPI